jgi:hypothetical protein
VYDGGNLSVHGERECEREKNDGEIQMQEPGDRDRYWTEGEEKRCRMCREEKETIKHMWSGCGEMSERERKERGEILNDDGREIQWMKEIWKRREGIEKKRGGR